MNVAVQSIQAVHFTLEGGKKSSVQILAPVGRDNNVCGSFQSKIVRRMIDFRIGNVPPFFNRATPPEARLLTQQFKGCSNAYNPFYLALTVFAGAFDEPLNATNTKHRFAVTPFTNRTRHPKGLTTRQTAVTRFDHPPNFISLARYNEVRRAAFPHQRR
jgi:hypothetical protein